MDLAGLIRQARHDAGLTQRELARRAGTSQPALARYERGRAVPSLTTVERILAATGKRLGLSLTDAEPTSAGPVGRVVAAHREAVREILDQHGVGRAVVFGSVARGEDTSDSDLDLLVEMPRATYIRLASLRADLEDELGMPVDVTVRSLLSPEVERSIDAEARAL